MHTGEPVPGLAMSPEAMWIAALLDGARSGRESVAGSAGEGGAVRIGPGDDAAVVDVSPGTRLVVSSDASVEGIHFRRAWMTWEVVGYRAAAAALSDLAAMGAEPIGLTVSVALPPELDAGTASALGRGLGEALGVSGGEVLGGDLVASPGPVMLDVTVLGEAATPLTRSGARPGDELWVTGSLGGAAAAVADLQAGLEPLPEARQAFERPRPRIPEARWLSGQAEVTAMIDVSDGLARDARHLSTASALRVDVAYERLPAHPAVEPHIESDVGRRLVLAGGEDYELLFAAAPGSVAPIVPAFVGRFGLPLTRIGAFSEGRGLHVTHPASAGAPPEPDGFDHFSSTDA